MGDYTKSVIAFFCSFFSLTIGLYLIFYIGNYVLAILFSIIGIFAALARTFYKQRNVNVQDKSKVQVETLSKLQDRQDKTYINIDSSKIKDD